MKKKNFEVERSIFYPGAIILIAVILYGYAFNDHFNEVMSNLYYVVTDYPGWLIMLVTAALVFLVFAICFTPVGKQKVGGPDAKIKHSMFTWVAMVTCSGTATAVVFYAVGEPVSYFHNPPAWWGIEAGTMNTAVRALSQSVFHWGFTYYAMYAFWGFIAGYAVMNLKLPARPSSALYPVIQDRAFGLAGTIFDIIAMLALVGGLVTSLGLGVQQFASGLHYVFGIAPSNKVFVITLLLVIGSYTLSSGRGIAKGMAIISNINMYIYLFVIAFLYIVGDTVFEFKIMTQTIGEVITNFIPNITAADSFNVGNGWIANNTIFFVAWIMAYAPMVGLFQGKVAVGYTWRRFLLVNILSPGLFVLVWFVAFGGNAIHLDAFQGANLGAEIAEKGFPIANFALLNYLPLKSIMVPLVVAALFFGFITIADAMTGTLATMSIKNNTGDEAPVRMKAFWGILLGFDTFLCLFCLGTTGTMSLQFMSVVFGLPIFIYTCYALKGLGKICSGRMEAEYNAMSDKQREALSRGESPDDEDGGNDDSE
ncbi:MAG: BCCT family transporter [Planctomycetaceae bacterium]|nr:BCCT family transporter [Planctomycetaceae bacterium]